MWNWLWLQYSCSEMEIISCDYIAAKFRLSNGTYCLSRPEPEAKWEPHRHREDRTKYRLSRCNRKSWRRTFRTFQRQVPLRETSGLRQQMNIRLNRKTSNANKKGSRRNSDGSKARVNVTFRFEQPVGLSTLDLPAHQTHSPGPFKSVPVITRPSSCFEFPRMGQPLWRDERSINSAGAHTHQADKICLALPKMRQKFVLL